MKRANYQEYKSDKRSAKSLTASLGMFMTAVLVYSIVIPATLVNAQEKAKTKRNISKQLPVTETVTSDTTVRESFSKSPESTQATFTNSTPINIADRVGNNPGLGSIYPSGIVVSGLTGSITDVNVKLNGFTHSYPNDIGLLLVAPSGQSFVLQSDVGGGDPVSNYTYTLDDQAPSGIPLAGPMGESSYKPTSEGDDEYFPPGSTSPPPADCNTAPCAQPAPAGNATLNGTFASATANGTWKLYALDWYVGDTGGFNGGWTLEITTSGGTVAPMKPCFDFYGSGRTSFAIIDAELDTYVWRLRNNGGAGADDFGFGRFTGDGATNDLIAPGYYDNDNKADVGVYRRSATTNSAGVYYLQTSTTAAQGPNRITPVFWGGNVNGGIDAPQREADYDGDGRDDFTVLRIENGVVFWYILRSSDSTYMRTPFGEPVSDVFMAGADYNGDGRADLSVVRIDSSGNGTYIIGEAATGSVILTQPWGNYNTDFFIVGDYIGDSRADFVTWRGFGAFTNGAWQIKENGGSGQTIFTQFGIPGASSVRDYAVCGDYDGNGKSDIAVYRPSDKTFYWLTNPTNLSSMNNYTITFPPNTGNITGEIPVGFFRTY